MYIRKFKIYSFKILSNKKSYLNFLYLLIKYFIFSLLFHYSYYYFTINKNILKSIFIYVAHQISAIYHSNIIVISFKLRNIVVIIALLIFHD